MGLNDLPNKIVEVHENLQQLFEEEKISQIEQEEIEQLLNEMNVSHNQHLEELKQRYWSMLIEQKDKYKKLERISNANEITLRQKLESIQLSTQQLSSQQIEFDERMKRLKEEHLEQHERQEKRLKLSNNA